MRTATEFRSPCRTNQSIASRLCCGAGASTWCAALSRSAMPDASTWGSVRARVEAATAQTSRTNDKRRKAVNIRRAASIKWRSEYRDPLWPSVRALQGYRQRRRRHLAECTLFVVDHEHVKSIAWSRVAPTLTDHVKEALGRVESQLK